MEKKSRKSNLATITVTHIFTTIKPIKDYWQGVPYFSKVESQGPPKYIRGKKGWKIITQEEIDEEIRHNRVKALDAPCVLQSNQSIFMNPKGEVYRADRDLVVKDTTKTLVGNINY